MSFTFEDLKNALENYEDDNFSPEEFYSEVGYSTKEEHAMDIPGVGKAVGVKDFGGEGQGDTRWVIFRIIGDDRLFRKNGYYASHYGTDWDGELEQVEAYERVVTDYRRV